MATSGQFHKQYASAPTRTYLTTNLAQRRPAPRSQPIPHPAPESDVQSKSDRDSSTSRPRYPNLIWNPQRYGVQPKLTVGAPNDKYEQEADRVASEVVNQINTPQPAQIQRADNLEDEELQAKPLTNSIAPEVQRADNLEEEELQTKPLTDSIAPEVQRADNLEEEDLQMKPVQRVAEAGGTDASPDLETSIAQARGGGQPLDPSVREPIEQAMGADFSGVKVHTDAQADQLNRSIQAKAFTTGQDVFFRQGEYNPGSRGGQELIAHELTHVVQQRGKTMLQKRDYNPNPVPSSAPISLTAHHVIPHSSLVRYKDEDIAKDFIPSKDTVTLEQLVNIHLIPPLDNSRWGKDYSDHSAMSAKAFLSDTKVRNSSKNEQDDYQIVLTAINKIDTAKTGRQRNTDITGNEAEEITGSFFLWNSANIFIGPSPQLRDWDPGSDGLDTDAQYFLESEQYNLLVQIYESIQAQGNDKDIKKKFGTLATNYNRVTPYDPGKWTITKPSTKYHPLGRRSQDI